MPGLIRRSDIDEVRSRIDLTDVSANAWHERYLGGESAAATTREA